jgi:hypothetical protein
MKAIEYPATQAPNSAVTDLSAILLAGLKALADAGEADQACRLAGRTCAVLRSTHAAEWRRFNVLLHRLARLTSPVGRSAFATGSSAENDLSGPL